MSECDLISSDVKFENPKRRGVAYMRCNAPSPPKKSPEIARFQDFFSGYPNKPLVLPGERETSGATIKRASYKQARDEEGMKGVKPPGIM